MKTIIDIKNSVIKKDTIYQVILYVSTMGGNATATFNIGKLCGKCMSIALINTFFPSSKILLVALE